MQQKVISIAVFLPLHKEFKQKIQCRPKEAMLEQNLTLFCNNLVQNKSFRHTCSNSVRHPEFWLLNEKLKLPRAQDIAAIKGPQKAVNIICMLRAQQVTLSHSFQTDAVSDSESLRFNNKWFYQQIKILTNYYQTQFLPQQTRACYMKTGC